VEEKYLQDAARRDVTASPASKGARELPRECRLLRKAEYDSVYREGQRRSNREFTVFLRRNGLERSRFGWSVKKALGGAVKRNRVRRRLREIVRLHREEILPGWDVVIHPRSTAATAQFALLVADLLKLLPRA